MTLKALATLATAIVASSAWAGTPADTKCGAGSCGKKENAAPQNPTTKDAGCSKKDGAMPTQDASGSKKDASCAKK